MIRKTLSAVLAAALLSGCATSMTLDDHRYRPVGVVNAADKGEHVAYKVSYANLALAVLLVQTVVVPVYVIGWALEEPVGRK